MPGSPQHLRQRFSRAWYYQSGRDELVIALETRDSGAGAQGERIEQIVVVETFWRPHPGRTPAEPTMINATLWYAIRMGREWVGYRGAGFVSYGVDRATGHLRGHIESVLVHPAVRSERVALPFRSARISGEVVALPHAARAAELARRVEAIFAGADASPTGGTKAQ